MGALVLGACSGSAGPRALTPTTTTTAPCAVAGSSGTSTVELTVSGAARTALVHAPPAPRARGLVLNLHGTDSDAARHEAFSGMDATADRLGFVVVYPQGALHTSSGFEWNVPGVPLASGAVLPANPPDDEGYLRALAEDLAGRYCVDRRHIFVAGYSGGARMASQLACDASDLFAAAGAVDGLRKPDACLSARPVAVIGFHGTADPINPYGGGRGSTWSYSVLDAASRWGAFDRCASAPVVSRPAISVALRRYRGCGGGTDVELYVIIGFGHQWPGGPPQPPAAAATLGPQSDAVDASTELWRFFAAHPRPAAPAHPR